MIHKFTCLRCQNELDDVDKILDFFFFYTGALDFEDLKPEYQKALNDNLSRFEASKCLRCKGRAVNNGEKDDSDVHITIIRP